MQHTTINADQTSLVNAYGQGANSLLDQMAFQVSRLTGKEANDWEFRIYENGLLMPVPAGLTSSTVTEAQLRDCFYKAITRTAEALVVSGSVEELPENIVKACESAAALKALILVN